MHESTASSSHRCCPPSATNLTKLELEEPLCSRPSRFLIGAPPSWTPFKRLQLDVGSVQKEAGCCWLDYTGHLA